MAGDIIALTGIENIDISDTIASVDNPQAMTKISIDEPTLSMIFSVNNFPSVVRMVNTLPAEI